jgi:aspartate racemase
MKLREELRAATHPDQAPTNKTPLTLGLVGGFGVAAAVHYYQFLAKAHEKRGYALKLFMAHADISKARQYVEANDRVGLAEYLASLIGKLKDAGAEVAAIAAITPHVCLSELISRSALPIIDPLQSARNGIGNKRVALFGTRFTIESDMFGGLTGVNVIRPSPKEIHFLNEAYFRVALSGTASIDYRRRLTELAHLLLQRDNLDAIVIAGTDLSPLFEDLTLSFPHIDCSHLHIESIMRVLCDGC